jgi:hypothetical protein
MIVAIASQCHYQFKAKREALLLLERRRSMDKRQRCATVVGAIGSRRQIANDMFSAPQRAKAAQRPTNAAYPR